VVRFAPAARNAWHSHAVGQTLHVTEGRGLIQSHGGKVIEIGPATPSTRPAASGTGTAPPPTTS
jgi:quercetin dioxygenase-like cupin family protein